MEEAGTQKEEKHQKARLNTREKTNTQKTDGNTYVIRVTSEQRKKKGKRKGSGERAKIKRKEK